MTEFIKPHPLVSQFINRYEPVVKRHHKYLQNVKYHDKILHRTVDKYLFEDIVIVLTYRNNVPRINVKICPILHFNDLILWKEYEYAQDDIKIHNFFLD